MAETRYFTPNDTNQSATPSSTTSLTLAYRTFGDPKNPAVFIPSCYSGKLGNTLTFLYLPSDDGVPPVLQNFFCVICGLLGGSESSSPSNVPEAIHGPRFPKLTYEDNIRLQHALCLSLGITKLHAYIGFSMGGQQAYHMATIFPDFVDHIVVLAGSARTSWHNYSFLEGPKAALVNSVDFLDGDYQTPATRGTRAFSRVYATWALSQAWFRARSWETLGYADLEEYLRVAWEGGQGKWDAHDLLAMIHTWQGGDISKFGPDEHKGNLEKALARITAKALIMPSRTDFYFPPEDSEEEVKHLKHGQLRVIESIWGHFAGGGGGTKEDNEYIKNEVKRFLAE
ncbi:AB hydrolase-1 domain-containing protein [Mycena indigotica]|uniref:AB hydrolase-1 domain-containing protein n=1 Tax=Mycena indigotica TaxID=2126181 RepID=A0A8H6TAB8_9AGAR|nr:AB hydrolase-1 domain-containing protein [Mycena indigotica]KAF7315095.1 AB hydrolase-1 domain-containing protein [Mycena indigotica]